jgi:hypothetical protein
MSHDLDLANLGATASGDYAATQAYAPFSSGSVIPNEVLAQHQTDFVLPSVGTDMHPSSHMLFG